VLGLDADDREGGDHRREQDDVGPAVGPAERLADAEAGLLAARAQPHEQVAGGGDDRGDRDREQDLVALPTVRSFLTM
jgi:hypothetical protein